MSVSRLHFSKSETRDLAEHARLAMCRLGEPTDWSKSNSWFFTVFVVIAAALTLFALFSR
ncbi:MAG: hypothetical protein JWP01_469 [Myxococcales bacterium]|nr:hypothetical protein [Myxococcales bacterium]